MSRAGYETSIPIVPAAKPTARQLGPEGTLSTITERAARQYRDDFLTPRMLSGLWRGTEFLILAGTGLALLGVLVGWGTPILGPYVLAVVAASCIGVGAIEIAHGYDLSFLKEAGRRLMRVPFAWALALAGVLALLFLLEEGSLVSRPWIVSWFLVGTAGLLVARTLLRGRLLVWGRNGRLERRAVVVGGGTVAEKLIRDLESDPESDIRICGIFDDRTDRRSPPLVAGYPKLGNISELVSFARLARIDMLIVTLPLSAEKRLLALMEKLWVLPIDIRLSAHSGQLRFRQRTYSYVGNIPMMAIMDRPVADWDWIAKRVFDVVFAALALVALSPVFLVTAIAIRLDSPGPVFFRQKRHGFNNKVIEILKFRSLYHHQSDPEARSIVTKNDKRVTRVGRFIRRSSIDELPQLLNVLTGQLSLVGPRPHAVHAISSANQTFVEIVEGYFGRHKVKPGITGWAQINGWRGEIDQPDKLKKRFEYDLYYIENWSLLLDFSILLRTPFSLLKSDSAY